MITPIVWLTSVTTDEGAKTGLWSATAAKSQIGNGKFYFPIGVEKEDKHTKDAGLRDELWQWTSDELTKHGGPGWPEQ